MAPDVIHKPTIAMNAQPLTDRSDALTDMTVAASAAAAVSKIASMKRICMCLPI